MKILMIAPTPFFADRGCHMRILGEIRALQKLGHKIILCTYHHGRDIVDIEIRRTPNIPWYKKTDAGYSWHKFYVDILLFLRSLIVFLKERPDIIHGHLHEGVLIGHLIRRLTFKNTPLVFDAQGSLTKELVTYSFLKKDTWWYRFWWKIERWLSQLPDFTVGSNLSVSEFMVKEMECPQEKVATVIDGVHTGFFTNNDDRGLKKRLNIPDHYSVVSYTGSLLKSKGIDNFLKTIPLITKEKRDVFFLIVGYPVEDARRIVRELNVDKYCCFVGRIDYFELPRYLNITDVAVDPKIDEAGEASGKIINYMGAGLPIVCFEGVNNRKFLAENGIYARSGDIEDLAKRVIEVLNNKQWAAQIGKANRERVESVFSWDSNIKEYEGIFKRLLLRE